MMPTAPILSILMPAYGMNPYLPHAIDSVFRTGGLADVELVIQNGGPSIRDRIPIENELLRYHEAADTGQAQALNRAASRATGEYLGWLNSDDLYSVGALRRVADVLGNLTESKPDIIYGSYLLIDGSDRVIRRCHPAAWDRQRIMRRGCYVFSGALFIRRSLWEQLGGLDERYHFSMDLDLHLRIPGDVPYVKVPEVLGALRIHPQSKTGSRAGGFAHEQFLIRRRNGRGVANLGNAIWASSFTVLAQATQGLRYGSVYSRFRSEKYLG